MAKKLAEEESPTAGLNCRNLNPVCVFLRSPMKQEVTDRRAAVSPLCCVCAVQLSMLVCLRSSAVHAGVSTQFRCACPAMFPLARWAVPRAEVTMTANKSAKAATHTRGNKTPRVIPDRCQSASPPPILSVARGPAQALSDGEDCSGRHGYARVGGSRPLSLRDWGNRSATLRSSASSSLAYDFQTQSRLIKARSISCLDNRLSIYRPAAAPSTAAASGASTRGAEQKENRQDAAPAGEGLSWSTVSLRTPPSSSIRRQISEWECRRVALPRMSLCLEKRGPPAEPPGSLLSSPCSDVPPSRRTSASFSDRSYPEPEGVQQDPPSRKEKCAAGRGEPAGLYARSLSSRKEGGASAVLSRIQKIEQALKDSPSLAAPQYPSSCYGPDRVTPRASATSSPCSSKRGSVSSAVTEPEGSPVLGSGLDALSRVRQRFSVISTRSVSPDLPPPSSSPSTPPTPVNPVPKPKRTFEYEANRSHGCTSPSNGLPPARGSEAPPPLPSTPPPTMTRTQEGRGLHSRDRDSCESEDTASLGSSHLSSPAENGLGPVESRSRPASKSTSEENAYEDILESMRENPYEDVDLRDRGASRKAPRDSPNRMRTPQDRKFNSPPQLPSKPTSQSLRLPGVTDRKCRASRLTKRHSHDDMLLLPPPCSLLDERLSDGLPCQPRRVPKLVRRINSIYCAKRGKKRLKKLSLSSIDTASLRDDNSESESDSDDRFKAHTQRLQKLQSMLRRAPSYRTLELQLLEWQERELFQYFVVISLKKKPTKSSYAPELERPTKEMREAEQRLKAIPQFCFPDAKDWSPPSGKGPRLPEVYCVISRLGCFDLFSKILDEVERRREISAALVMELRRPADSRLEHVDLESLFRCLSVRQVVRVFASLLLERRVIFVADKLRFTPAQSHPVLGPLTTRHKCRPLGDPRPGTLGLIHPSGKPSLRLNLEVGQWRPLPWDEGRGVGGCRGVVTPGVRCLALWEGMFVQWLSLHSGAQLKQTLVWGASGQEGACDAMRKECISSPLTPLCLTPHTPISYTDVTKCLLLIGS
ncbi:hypothetical protein JZ751_016973 [Albula glossodonta]|uniref:cDENN domain-containing protein n=1 Tax=Albula glossodonta TaxID=121402 RepID=A0A8T2MTX8_9TELE|nr:hypothetical protein JZ751_016973 [Albula glossodonta]